MSAVIQHQPAQAPGSIIRTDTPERWQRASERAALANVIVTLIDDVGTYQVTSASYPGVAYATDGLNCTCTAGQHGDPVCLHRAAVRDVQAQQNRCTVCGGSGWEHFSIWDWRNGCAVDLYSIRCACQDDPEPEPESPAPLSGFGLLEQALGMAKATLSKIDDQLAPFNHDLKHGDGSYELRNRRTFDRLTRQREIAQQAVWDVQDALTAAQQGQVAA